MQNKKVNGLIVSSHAVPWLLLVLCILAYGLLIPTLGYYWDDWPYAWINHLFGPGGYPEFVALDRPHSAWIFMLLTTFLGEQPIGYHITSLLLFWLCTVLFWHLLRLIWPEQEMEVLWAAMLFAIYPGFLGHPQAIIYNHHFAAMALYLFSFIGMVRALQVSAKGYWSWRVLFWHLPALGALVLSQFSIEYFLGWEVVRPVIIWLALKKHNLGLERRIRWSILCMIPYGLGTLGFLLWRVFIFRFPTYQPVGRGASEFILHEWALKNLTEFFNAIFVAWKRAFPQLSPGEFSKGFWIVYLALIGFTAVLVFLFLYFLRHHKTEELESDQPRGVKFGTSALFMAFVGLTFAGWPFWLTNLTIDINSRFNSRFTMAFMPWVGLLFASLFHFFYRNRLNWMKILTILLVAFLVAGSLGYHFWNANFYRNEWLVTQRYFQQMVHRIPGLTPKTSIVINDLRALSLYEDDSLTAILNWTYAPENTSQQIDYIVQYLSVRLGWEIPSLEPGLPIKQSIRSLNFSGSTDQMLVVYYQPPGCLRVLDYEHPERLPEDFNDFMIQALPFSKLSLIKTEVEERVMLPLHLFDELTSETWCLYFEEADLAGQRGNWERVVALGDRAFTLEDQSNEVSELFVFIEGYLRMGRLDDAQNVSILLSERSAGFFDEAICGMWREVGGDIPGDFDPDFDLATIYETFCGEK